MLPFYAINGVFNTVLGPLTQNGIDMAPTKSEVETWESGCMDLTAAVNSWNTMLGAELVSFNSLLTQNNLTPLKIAPSAARSAPSACTFVPSAKR